MHSSMSLTPGAAAAIFSDANFLSPNDGRNPWDDGN
jgi:hypothetical protein